MTGFLKKRHGVAFGVIKVSVLELFHRSNYSFRPIAIATLRRRAYVQLDVCKVEERVPVGVSLLNYHVGDIVGANPRPVVRQKVGHVEVLVSREGVSHKNYTEILGNRDVKVDKTKEILVG